MWWFLICCAAFGAFIGLGSGPRYQRRYYYDRENEYDYDGGSSDCGGCDHDHYSDGGGDRE